MISAVLRVRTSSKKISNSIINAISPDNVAMKNLRIKARSQPSHVRITVTYDGRIETFISTMEDLLQCVQAANTTMEGIVKQ